MYYLYFKFILESRLFLFLVKFLTKKWYFDIVYNILSRIFLKFIFNYLFFKGDRGFLELIGPLGITRLISKLKTIFIKYENNNLFQYFIILVISFLSCIIICILFFIIIII